jgi:hypothetical protein
MKPPAAFTCRHRAAAGRERAKLLITTDFKKEMTAIKSDIQSSWNEVFAAQHEQDSSTDQQLFMETSTMTIQTPRPMTIAWIHPTSLQPSFTTTTTRAPKSLAQRFDQL